MRADKLANELGNLEPRIELPEEQWCEIELAIGIETPNKLFRSRVEHYVTLALPLQPPSFGEAAGLKLSTARKYISNIHKDSQRLAATLSKLQAQAELGDKTRIGRSFTALIYGANFWTSKIPDYLVHL